MMKKKADIVIIGGGPAGMAAAIKAKENGVKKVLILERNTELGGILQQCIHTGFGLQIFGEEYTGPEYAERFINKTMNLNIEVKLDTMVLKITRDRKVYAINPSNGLLKVETKAIILAMGCRERSRGAIKIPGTRPAGIFTAGTAQRYVNILGYVPGNRIVVLGSGDVGLIMARRLTLEGAKVKAVLEIQPYPGGLMRNVVQCLQDFGIPLLLQHTVIRIHGKNHIEGVTVAQVDNEAQPISGSERYIPCDTLILSVGLIPENELSRKAGIEIDPSTGGPIIDEACETSVSGIYSCGNVVHVHDIADYVTDEGYRAGHYAALYTLNKIHKIKKKEIKVKAGTHVKYVVPQRIRREGIDTIPLSLRVMQPEDKVYVNFMVQHEVIYRHPLMVVRPSETLILPVKEAILRKIDGSEELIVNIEKRSN